MSYIIEPMPMISFLEDNKIKLPRFQRKATWDKKQNFELAISVFQDYPVGVVIVNQEQKTSWLLDGRQRRSALSTMRDNPVELYEWARSYIGFGKTADNLEVARKYWNKVEKYLQEENTDKKDGDDNDDVNNYGDEDSTLPDSDADSDNLDDQKSFNSDDQRKGIQTLLDIILMVHQNKPSGSRWEQTFDFRKDFTRLKYAPSKNGNKIDPKALRRFILDLLNAIDRDNEGKRTQEFFVEYYLQNFDVKDQKKFEKDVSMNWNDILNSLDVIDRSEKVFSDARIGIIRLTRATPLDAQNIFSRINKGGTQLKAEELLSAKPYWNKEVSYVDPTTTDKIKEMYSNLEIPFSDSAVRWDIAATFISRIKDENLVFDTYEDSRKKKEISMDEVSLGFKLLASIYVQGMSSKHVSELELNENIRWESDIDQLAGELNIVCSILLADTFFKYYQSWKRPITKLMGNAIALEFLTIMWLDWKEYGCPSTVSAETKALQRDARILFDKLVFEYATKTWRGSGDSKMSSDIKNWKQRIVPVSSEDWSKFISGACKGNYNGQDTSVKTLKPVLYYYYAITDCLPINQVNVSFDVDHIIPQERFVGNTMINQTYKDSLINLALLPTKDNISKKAKALNEITDSWLKKEIIEFAGIPEDKFELYSDVSNIEELYNSRSKLFEVAFSTNRTSTLSK